MAFEAGAVGSSAFACRSDRQLAASVVDGDLHRRLLDPANYSAELYATALKPLVRFHSANSDLFYVYTMVDRDHAPYFILDTAASGDLRTKNHLRASGYMEPFKLREKYEGGWLDQIAAGKTYVTPTYEHDDYGYFLTAHVPIYDSQGAYSGFVGVDFDMAYYLAEEARFRLIEIGSVVAAAMVALLIGFLIALYYGDLQRRMRELYYRATRDDLTGLLEINGERRRRELHTSPLGGMECAKAPVGWIVGSSPALTRKDGAGIGLDFVRPCDHSPPNFDAEGALWRRKRCWSFREL